jgi:hypothetical protein
MLKEKIEAAFMEKNNNIKSFVWKGKKEEVNGQIMQREIRLMDATEEQLREFYDHCQSMLYNTNKDNPGRYTLLEIIKEQRMKCNTELFLRWLKEEKDMPRFRFMESLRNTLNTNRDVITNPDEFPISGCVGGCPEEFADIPVSMVLDGCIDKLGKFNKQHLTLTFILKQGLWFTAQESKDLIEKNEKGEIRDKLEVAKERLNLKTSINLYVTPKGLSYGQLRSMITLKSKKYSELTTGQLETLRNRILFSLEDEVRFHINQWETRKNQILQVCEARNITL